MLSKRRSSLIRSLHRKKERQRKGLFLVEGRKNVLELIESGIKVRFVLGTEEAFSTLPQKDDEGPEYLECGKEEFEALSTLDHPEGVLAVAHIPEEGHTSDLATGGPLLCFESLSDPGNLGTILRTADHFGIPRIFLSKDSVDPYNPKVVRSSMGSLFRVRPVLVDFSELLEKAKGQGRSCIAARSGAPSLYSDPLPANALLLFGNEAEGLSDNLLARADASRSIPAFGEAESLNVAVSAAIFCSELMRGSGCR